jgi:hypothetical protein
VDRKLMQILLIHLVLQQEWQVILKKNIKYKVQCREDLPQTDKSLRKRNKSWER